MAPRPRLNITLYRGWPTPNEYPWSPFVAKLELRLRLANLPYKTEQGSPAKSPQGKIPYVAVSYDDAAPPRILADSGVISQTLVEEGVADDLNAKLTPEQRVQDVALRALMEHKLYFYQIHERWAENYYAMREGNFGFMPWPLRVVVALIASRKSISGLYSQGTGRFSTEEISAFRKEIWADVNGLVSAAKQKSTREKGPFWVLGGSEPTEADTTMFGFIVSGLTCTAAPETMGVVKSYPALTDYAARIHEKYFPDYKLWE